MSVMQSMERMVELADLMLQDFGRSGRRRTYFMPIVREVLLSDRDFLGLLYLRDVIRHDRV